MADLFGIHINAATPPHLDVTVVADAAGRLAQRVPIDVDDQPV